MAGYFEHFAFQAVSSEQFLDYIDRQLLQSHPGIVSRAQLEQWLYEPGLPADATAPASDNLERAAGQARAWASGELPVDKLSTDGWSPQAIVYFIKALPAGLEGGQLTQLDRALGLSASPTPKSRVPGSSKWRYADTCRLTPICRATWRATAAPGWWNRYTRR
jgi:hypothetical protein